MTHECEGVDGVKRMGWYGWWWIWTASVSERGPDGFSISVDFKRTKRGALKAFNELKEEQDARQASQA